VEFAAVEPADGGSSLDVDDFESLLDAQDDVAALLAATNGTAVDGALARTATAAETATALTDGSTAIVDLTASLSAGDAAGTATRLDISEDGDAGQTRTDAVVETETETTSTRFPGLGTAAGVAALLVVVFVGWLWARSGR
jgi:cobalamin biosynthesis Mg chelatase CobN